MRLLICGSRNWTDKQTIADAIDNMSRKPTVVIEGGAKGADALGQECAKERGIPVETYPTDWESDGKAAGFIRNKRMLDDGRPGAIFAFHDDLENSKGTKDMVQRGQARGIPVYVFGHFAQTISMKGFEV